MTHTVILKVKKFQVSSAKHFDTVEKNLQGGGDEFHPPTHPVLHPFRVNVLDIWACKES